MRNFTLLIVFLTPFSLFGLTRTSVVAGAWNNPSTWSPSGVPTPADDSIIVATGVTFFGQNIVFGNSVFRITSTGSLNAFNTDTITFGGDYFLNESYVGCGVFVVGATDSAVNRGQMEFQEVLQSGTFINYGNVCIAMELATSDDVINNGDVSCDTWINGAVVSGNGGQFCIANNFINTDQISGNIDICDNTPGGFGDQNMGTISGSVTTCAAGPCGSCVQPGFAEYYQPSSVSVNPHPVNTISTFEFELPQMNDGSESDFIVTDVSGRVVKQITFSGNKFSFDRAGMESGVYLYSVVSTDKTLLTGKMIVQ